VLDIDRERQRISLGLKQTQADPWQDVIERYQINDVAEGKVTKVVTFGAFVEIHSGVEGLVHISELATHHVENPREIVSQGDIVSVRVIEIDGSRRRLSLSLKRVADSDPVDHALPEEVKAQAAAEAAAAPPPVDPDALGASVEDDDELSGDAEVTVEPAVEPTADEPVADETVAGQEPAVEPVAEQEPAVEPTADEPVADETVAGQEPAVEPVAEQEPAVEPAPEGAVTAAESESEPEPEDA